MKRWAFLLLTLSVGLNAGLLGMHLHRGGDAREFRHAKHGAGSRARMEREHRTSAGREEWRHRLMEHRLERLADELALTEEQRAVFQAVHEEYMPRIFEKRDAEQSRREAMMNQLLSVSTKEEVQAIVRERAEMQRAIDSLVVDAMFRQLTALDAEQRTKYLAEFPWGRELGEGPPHGRGPGRGHGPGRGGAEND